VGKVLCLFPAVPALVIRMTGCAVNLEKLAVQGLFFRSIVVYLLHIMAMEAFLPAWPGKSCMASETIVAQLLMTGGHGPGLQELGCEENNAPQGNNKQQQNEQHLFHMCQFQKMRIEAICMEARKTKT
jgi:hypothetical protein